MELVKLGVDFQIRELFESALVFGKETLLQLGASEEEAVELIEAARERDRMRFEAQVLGGDVQAARDFMLKNAEEQAREAGRTGGPSEPIVPADGQPERV